LVLVLIVRIKDNVELYASLTGSAPYVESPDAEIAILVKGKFVTNDWRDCSDDTVLGWVSPNDVLDALNWAAKQERVD